jgi:hypothetical protein
VDDPSNIFCSGFTNQPSILPDGRQRQDKLFCKVDVMSSMTDTSSGTLIPCRDSSAINPMMKRKKPLWASVHRDPRLRSQATAGRSHRNDPFGL